MSCRGGLPRLFPRRELCVESVPRPTFPAAITLLWGCGRMTPSLRRFGITLAFVGSASLLATTVGAQPPVYLTQWPAVLPSGVAVDGGGNVYVTDPVNCRVQKFTNTGTLLTQWGSAGSGDGQFQQPYGVAVDGGGHVVVTDLENNRIQVFTGAGGYLWQWGAFGTGNGQFSNPFAVAVDGSGDVFVADFDNFRIQKF